jgi:hypothetical protein
MTETAYSLGERVTGLPKYVTLNSFCDLVSSRRQFAALLRIAELRRTHPDAKRKLDLLFRFRKRESMYLRALPIDDASIIQFDGICKIRTSDLLLAGESRPFRLSAGGYLGVFRGL